jgi:hypothetical protein
MSKTLHGSALGNAVRATLFSTGLVFLAACGGEPRTGAVEVHWDRDVCERCQMSISDPHFAAQVRTHAGGEAHKFDDLGCAVLWMAEHAAEGEAQAELWVRDLHQDRWLDGFRSHYVSGQKTPMGFGWGASADATQESVGFAEVEQHIRARERERKTSHRRP